MRYLVVLLLLAGCASNWKHPTKDQQDYKADRYECNRDGISAGGTGLLGFALINECMEAKGWTR